MEERMATSRAKKSPGKAKKVQERSPGFQGWNTTDEDELERRRWRGLSDVSAVENLEPEQPYFGTFRVRSTSGGSYEVEIRSLTLRENSCGCPDWRVNGLGTCKHIEGVLEALRRKGKRKFAAAGLAGSPRVEIFPAVDGSYAVQLRRPRVGNDADAVIARYADPAGLLAGDPLSSLSGLRRDLDSVPPGAIRFSRHVESRMGEETRRRRRIDDRASFLAEVAAGAATIDVLHHPLLPYQVDGMLHLAFGERVLLADEMGLGKTVQAIAACELLRRLRGIARVLVVLPASLKAEWEDQIARFTDLSVTVVSGPRPERLRRYTAETFFILVNYEQVLIDRDDINHLVGADIVILDEAQRIKNWQTKTAQAVKQLRSPFAFVLTGTPLENRIDEVYSIVQYLDPRLLGPLFRFNRDFYVLDDRGRPTDYKNLTELRNRLAPVMLRRRKDEVEDQLPGRTVDTYYVAMTPEQRLRYADYEVPASRLIALAQRRPLIKEEFDRLQQLLACMRMICDTPYILDPTCRVAPKLDELENVLAELLTEPGRKIIIFSEWERMLELVRELAIELGAEFAWHTGSVPQDKRRVEIRRFKNDPACRLFLSTDSGSVGLNLQAASAVINMDLPWNPARLEQRIARAWRKHQTRTVTVINLVCEDSIEHRIQHILAQKQGLADGVLDGRGDVEALKMPSGRAAMVEMLAALLHEPEPAPRPPVQDSGRRFAMETIDRLSDAVLLIERYRRDEGGETMVVVMEGASIASNDERQRLVEAAEQAGIAAIEIIERSAWETIRRLAGAGIIRLSEAGELLHRSPTLDQPPEPEDRTRRMRNRQAALDWLGQADRKLRMATLLADGGFAEEALPPLGEVASLALRGLAIIVDPELDPALVATIPEAELTEMPAVRAQLPPGSIADLALIGSGVTGAANIDASKSAAQGLLVAARAAVEQSWAA
jgi:superfamily II DNA or RNA helicase